MLWDISRSSGSEMSATGGEVRATILMLRRDIMSPRTQGLDQALARRMPGDRGMAAILASFLAPLEDHGAECTPGELRRLGTVAVDLAVACLAQQPDAEDQLPAEVRTQALVQRIHAFIEHNLGDPELNPAAVAAHWGFSGPVVSVMPEREGTLRHPWGDLAVVA
ncbi:hypothetical protein ACFXA3_06950 [Streptomyces sp. NPDC059456]|uniref:hypothetical protein n=1 Tax=Streptomyces sp. NPDC059456 TaxID=3346838 RepID=UPI0036C1D838